MRIAHITDLHFGNHHQILARSLKARLAALKPDLIVCSGDVADSNSDTLAGDALEYLDNLAALALPASSPA